MSFLIAPITSGITSVENQRDRDRDRDRPHLPDILTSQKRPALSSRRRRHLDRSICQKGPLEIVDLPPWGRGATNVSKTLRDKTSLSPCKKTNSKLSFPTKPLLGLAKPAFVSFLAPDLALVPVHSDRWFPREIFARRDGRRRLLVRYVRGRKCRGPREKVVRGAERNKKKKLQTCKGARGEEQPAGRWA